MSEGPTRMTVRGGRDRFNWEDVKEDRHMHNYLGHSLNAPVGRWQNGRDLQWFSRAVPNEEKSREDEIREEKERVKKAERDAVNIALGLPPSPASSPKPVGIEARGDEMAHDGKQREREERRRERRDHRRQGRSGRSRSRSRSRERRPHRRSGRSRSRSRSRTDTRRRHRERSRSRDDWNDRGRHSRPEGRRYRRDSREPAARQSRDGYRDDNDDDGRIKRRDTDRRRYS